MSKCKLKQCCNTVVAAPPWRRQSHSLSLSTYVVSTYCVCPLSLLYSSCCMSIYMHAIAQRLYPSTVCVYSIPSAPSYPCLYLCVYPPYYVMLLLILLFCHPTILFTCCYLSISMFPSLLSVLSCLSSKALERLASIASLAYFDCLYVLSSVS